MRSIWAAAAMFIAGLSIVILRPAYLADEMATSVYQHNSGLVWLGWVLLVAGAAMLVFSFIRSRRNKRS